MRVVLADDHALVRDGIASLLVAWGHEVVGQATDGESAVDLVQRLAPDLVLMDVRMPGIGGIEATRRIKASSPAVAIVMLTASEDEDDLFGAIQVGAQGYLAKNLESDELRRMLDAVRRGEAAITPATAARILEHFQQAGRPPAPEPDRLTEREMEVLELVTRGLRNKEIASALEISQNTVKYHLGNILSKLHAQSRAELTARAIREGLVADPPAGD
jgi:DNA-binding NarL/FixJ family response regulator